MAGKQSIQNGLLVVWVHLPKQISSRYLEKICMIDDVVASSFFSESASVKHMRQ